MISLLLLACASTSTPAFTNAWTEVWNDNFDGAAGEPPDPDVWVPQVGGDGWGNDQLEYNTDRAENVALDGEGHLVITAIKEDYEGNAYTSARLSTQSTLTFGTGRFEADLKMPAGAGLWPAFWMLGTDYETAGWPACGEVDIMEMRGEEPETTLATVHGPGYSGSGGYGDSTTLREGTFAEDFHTFAVDIDVEHLAFWMDDTRVAVVRPGDVAGGWAFEGEWYMLLNLAVGGTFLDAPNEDTPFPSIFLIDAVRVYERAQPNE